MTALVGMIAVVAGLAAVVFGLRAAAADSARKQLTGRSGDLEKRLATAQEELNGVREELKRRQAALEDLRERAAKQKKKELREPQKAGTPAPGAASPDPTMMARFQAAVEVAERRAVAAEKELEAKLSEARDAVRRELQADVEELKRRLKGAERKAEEKPAAVEEKVEARVERVHIPAARIDVTKLDPTVVDELRRFYKRAVNSEKLLAAADSKLELVVDKLEETQKRYFAVCRELALVAVNKDKPQDVSDAEAARLAQEMVVASEEAGRRRSVMGTPRRRPTNPPRPEGSSEPRAEGGEGGEHRSRRLHRRGRGGGGEGAPRTPRVDGPRRERRPEGAPADAVKADASRDETAKAESPKAEAPKSEAPKVETPKAATAPAAE